MDEILQLHASTPVKACGVLIVRGDPVREVLLMKHPSRWDVPKGHQHDDEGDLECALRELEEETGITADDIELDPTFCFHIRYPVKAKRTGKPSEKSVLIYLGRLKRDVRIKVTEHEGYKWLKWKPPHEIQAQTIDPLLAHLAAHLAASD